MASQLITTDAHGRVIRCDQFPLGVSDELTLYSGQLIGTYRGYPHTNLPGRHAIVDVQGIAGDVIVLQKIDGNGRTGPFFCDAYGLRAILGEWSNYQICTSE